MTLGILIYANIIHAQWIQTNPPYGKHISCFAKMGNNIFAGSSTDGMFLSENNGSGWKSINNGLTNLDIVSIAVYSNKIFVGTLGTGIFQSTNNGASWAPVNNGLPLNTSCYALTIIGTTIYAGTYSGVYSSVNSGLTWLAVNNGLTNINVTSIASNNSSIFAGTYGGMFISSNNGNTWTPTNLNSTVVNSITVNNNMILASTSSGVFSSNDNGNNWFNSNTGLTSVDIFSTAISGGLIFSAAVSTTNGGVFVSNNNGNSWTPVNNGLANKSVRCLFLNGTRTFAGTDGGIFYSNDNGLSWNGGLPSNSTVNTIAIKDTNIFVGTTSFSAVGNNFNFGMYLSNNDGNGFVSIDTGLSAQISIYSSIVLNNGILIGTSNGVYFSNNNGNNWTAMNMGLPANVSVSSFAKDGNNIFLGTNTNGLFYTINNGLTWINNITFPVNSVKAIKIVGQNIYIGSPGGSNGKVYVSHDYGNTWNLVISGIASSVYSFQNIDSIVYFAYNGGVKKTYDNGNTWTTCNTGLSNTFISALLIIGDSLFAGTSGAVYVSADNGNSWNNFGTGLPSNIIVNTIANNDSSIYLGTTLGFWKIPHINAGQTTSTHAFKEHYIRFYPNPVETTLIVTDYTNTKPTILRLYNSLGKLVFENSFLNEITVDLSLVQNGIYVLMVQNDFEFINDKLIILK